MSSPSFAWRVCAVPLFILLGLSSPALAQAFESSLPRAVVLGLRAGDGVDPQRARSLAEILATELARTERFRVVTPSDVDALIDLSAKQEVLGCITEDCVQALSEIGGSMAAQSLFTGTVDLVDGQTVIHIVHLDTKTNEVVGRGAGTIEAEGLEATIQAVRRALLEALGYSGRIVLWNQPVGGQVYLDGRPVGIAPVPGIDVQNPGTYRLQVFHDDQTPWDRELEVPRGAVLRVKVDSVSLKELEAGADTRDAWGYGFLTAGGLGLVGGGVMWFLAGHAQQQYEEADFSGQPLSAQQPFTDTVMTRTVTAGVLTGIGLAAAGVGLWLIIDNDERALLESNTASTTGVTLGPTLDGGWFASFTSGF